MPAFRLRVEMGNAAFAENETGELARLLEETAEAVWSGADEGKLRDSNGNTVGSWRIEGERHGVA